MMQRLREFIEYLEGLEFRPLDDEFVRNLWPMIEEVIRNPASNQPAAIVLLLIAVTLMLILGIAVVLLVASFGGDDEEDYKYVVVSADGSSQGTTSKVVPKTTSKPEIEKDPLRFHRAALWAFGSFVLLLVVASVGSQGRSVCLSCHEGIAHTADADRDAHQSVRCTGCHESGGIVSSLTLAVPARMAHIAGGLFETERNTAYGTVSGASCRRCHARVSEETVEIPSRALLVSHAEPLEAGAGCMDCHKLNEEQKIGQETQGMSTCLRCHDDEQASAACPTCHVGDVSQAVLATRLREVRQLVGQPDCYTCHDPGSCDSCHGVRLPHPPNYRWSHMYDAAKDIWDNRGSTCYSCHTEERNSCYQQGCHSGRLAYHYVQEPAFPRTHGTGGGSAAQDRDDLAGTPCGDCHEFARRFDDQCEMCHQR